MAAPVAQEGMAGFLRQSGLARIAHRLTTLVSSRTADLGGGNQVRVPRSRTA